MILWIDAQLSPSLATWISANFEIEALPTSELGMLHARDREIFRAARESRAIVMTKDRDFLALLNRFGPPPQVLWVTCGNTSNARLRQILQIALPMALRLLEQGESLVEISDAR